MLRRFAVCNRRIAKTRVERRALAQHGRQVGIRRKRPALALQQRHVPLNLINAPVLLQRVKIPLVLDDSAAGNENPPAALAPDLRLLALQRAKRHFAALGKDRGNRHARFSHDLFVQIDTFPPAQASQLGADCALSAARHADEHDVLHVHRRLREHALDSRIRNAVPEEQLLRGLRLRNQHAQAAGTGYAQLHCAKQQRSDIGVVHEVEHARAARKPRRIGGSFARLRNHAQRGSVDQHLRVRMALQIAIVVCPVAGNDNDLARTAALCDIPRGQRRAAAAKDDDLSPRERNPRAGCHVGESIGVRIVPGQRAVAFAHDGIDAANLLRGFVQPVAVGQYVPFIRNCHVQPGDVRAREKRAERLRLERIERIRLVAQRAVNGHRVTMPQRSPDQSVKQRFHR